ncbi:GntR family transcriptional regulator [Vibrio sp. SCSIO 43135]|uniref:GntR family transcriptional regulator n=1 Tax=Vibrio sp. SCSIO 43135 TaxID=2819096 RepID=UPI0020759EAB|nr:GntR family transcriptional regulator [Vibrio sp. SCSIO 43135]USD41541.1 GntR family transcriptional regulator [Vibrio sp. SCSIO 43135]
MSSPTLTDKVSKLIRQDILEGHLIPGQKLVVAELSKRYSVGASPVREALVQLSWTKYVKLAPQKGCWVAPMCKEELDDLFDSLKIISDVLLRKAMKSGCENWELDVLTSFHKLARVAHTPEQLNKSEWEQRHYQFHCALLEGAKAHNMYSFFSEIINQITRYRYYAINRHSDEALFDVSDHEMIMKLVLARDTEQATALLDKHLNKAHRYIESALTAA